MAENSQMCLKTAKYGQNQPKIGETNLILLKTAKYGCKQQNIQNNLEGPA